MSSAQHHGAFGRPALPHTIVIARGETIRHFTVRPSMLALTAALCATIALGAFGSVGYVLLHDDLQTAGIARQARLAQAYEDRIATLRAQLDRSVSRQLLDREKVETKVAVLLDQQVELEARYDKLAPLLDRARSSGLIAAAAVVPIPQANPRPLESAADAHPLGFASAEGPAAFDRFKLVDRLAESARSAPVAGFETPLSPDLIRSIGEAVETHEARQIEKLDALALDARTKAAGITDALRSEGIAVPLPKAESLDGQGGPFVPVPEGFRFEASLDGLDTALTRLDSVQTVVRLLPLERPVSSSNAISSTFGVRSDPFLGRAALHTGLDFAAQSGTRIAATATGTVVSAGLSGGYGQMVEIDHGDGYATRYGHMSRILVEVGDKVSAGRVIGEVGSTGRSTGPHLHYEVRRSGIPVDPAGYLRAGTKIDRLG